MVWVRINFITVCVGFVVAAGCQAPRKDSAAPLRPAIPSVTNQLEVGDRSSAGESFASLPAADVRRADLGQLASEFPTRPVEPASFSASLQEEPADTISQGTSDAPPANALKGNNASQLEGSEPNETPEDSSSDGIEGEKPEEIQRPPPSGLVRRQDSAIQLEDVLASVYRAYPLLDAALQNRDIADGEQMAAVGNFDLQFRASAEHGPTGYYRTYRHRVGFEQPTYWGGQVFAGYRVGRGNFEPWYRERQTNDGGEFRAGVLVPLTRNIDIDPYRAALWRANFGRELAEPQIQRQLIMFVRDATYAYWYWVGSGRKVQIQQTVLQLAIDRNEGLRRQVEEQLLDPPELEDNRRLIVSREALVIDATRRLQQAAYGLSLYLRDDQGVAMTPPLERLPDFPDVRPRGADELELDLRRALQNRPELRELDLVRQQLEIDLAQATNELLPAIDGVVAGSQDVGAPTSSSRDKSQFELDAGLFVDVPVQRRRARGKQRVSEGKIAQVNAQRRLAADRVVMDVQFAHTALMAAYERIERARESVALAEYMASVERRKFEEGQSDLLLLNLREQQAAEAADIEVNALLEFFGAQADLRAALAIDQNP